MLGAEVNLQTRTDETPKVGTIVIPHYDFDEQPTMALMAYNHLGGNDLYFGAGNGGINTATDILFYTAQDTISLTGERRLAINRVGGIAAGEGTHANYKSQFTVGTHNQHAPNALFVVGDGTNVGGSPALSNALEVRKDGSTHAKVLRVMPAGDLSMGDFQSGPAPFAP